MGGMVWVVPVRYIGEPNGLAFTGHVVPLAKKLRATLSPCDGVAQVRVMVPSPLLTIDPVAAAFAGVAANNTTAETKNALATTMRVVRVNRDIGTPLGIGPNPLPDLSTNHKQGCRFPATHRSIAAAKPFAWHETPRAEKRKVPLPKERHLTKPKKWFDQPVNDGATGSAAAAVVVVELVGVGAAVNCTVPFPEAVG